jgi:predicted CXXCH cytochrome family protein
MGFFSSTAAVLAVLTVLAVKGEAAGSTSPVTGYAHLPCSDCHADLSSVHYRDMNPYGDPLVLDRYNEADQERLRRQPSCLDCHEVHDENGSVALVSDVYLQEVQRSRSVNPHANPLLCISCHEQGGSDGASRPLLAEGDINSLCNRCHHSEFARAEIHPVGIVPSERINIPPQLVLKDGKVTCETCHQSALQGCRDRTIPMGAENRAFLREPGLSRTAFCTLCHVRELYQRLNPHKQRNDDGTVREKTCLFCHAVRPDITVLGPENVTLKVNNPNEFCTGCHSGFQERHPSGGNHLVQPSPVILEALESSVQRIGVELPLSEGKIVCTTCHNPHDEGVIVIPAAAAGTRGRHKLRLLPGRSQCMGCHWDK